MTDPIHGHARLHRSLLAGAFALGIVGGCASGEGPVTTFPASTIGPDRTVTPAVGQTRAAIVTALAGQRLVLRDVQTPYRPAEAPLLATAPRAVYQVTLPEEPDKGYIVVYEFLDPGRAAEAAAEQQRYLATGPGKVQTEQGTVHVIRSVGTTVIVYDWLPQDARDPGAPGIQTALETLGVGYPVD
jgi:hypothetical protein